MPEEDEEVDGDGQKPVSTNLDRLAPLSTLSEFKLDEIDA